MSIISKSTNPYQLSNDAIESYDSQHYGLAIAKLYQAKKTLPRNRTINDNLSIIQDEIQLKQPVLLSYNCLSFSESLLILIAFTLIFVFRKVISKHHLIQFGIGVLYTLTLIICSATFVEQKLKHYAVIIEPSVESYSASDINSKRLFELLDGQIVEVLNREKRWSQISYDNKSAWVENSNLSSI